MQDYLQHRIAENELKVLVTNLGFSSIDELHASFATGYKQKMEIQRKFHEIINNAVEYQNKIETAASKVAMQNEFTKKVKYPSSACWQLLVSLTSLCNLDCANSEDWSTCIDVCMSAAISFTGTCFLFAD